MAVKKADAAASTTANVATNATEQVRGQFMTTLVSVDEARQENKNGKGYYRCVVNVTKNDGSVVSQPAIIYEANYNKGDLNIGEDYLTTLTVGNNGLAYLQMSHLQASTRLAAEDLIPNITFQKTVVAKGSGATALEMLKKALA